MSDQDIEAGYIAVTSAGIDKPGSIAYRLKADHLRARKKLAELRACMARWNAKRPINFEAAFAELDGRMGCPRMETDTEGETEVADQEFRRLPKEPVGGTNK